jgi:hypothetical protein
MNGRAAPEQYASSNGQIVVAHGQAPFIVIYVFGHRRTSNVERPDEG